MSQDQKMLRRTLMEVVQNQIREGTPPETKATLNRLKAEGHSHEEAMELIAMVLSSEIFEIMKHQRDFDRQRYAAALNRLPELPEG